MKFTSTIAAVFLALPALPAMAAAAAACKPMCCDAVVASINPSGNFGINCSLGGIDCGFSLQVKACCQGLTFGNNALGCE